MAKKKKLRQVASAEKEPTAKKRKTRATREQMIAQEEHELAMLQDPDLVEKLIEQKKASIAKRKADALEMAQKKHATFFQDIARHCKGIIEIHPQLDPQVLRDVAIDALDSFCKDIAGTKKVG